MTTERRKKYRMPLNMLVQYKVKDLDEFYNEFAGNISIGGMFIKTTQEYSLGSNIYFKFCLLDNSHIIEGLGKIVHINDADHPNPGIGIEFVNLDDSSKDIITDIINKRSQK